MASEERKRTPTFYEMLQTIVDKNLIELNTSMPARIISYDYEKNMAVVQPELKRKYKGEESAVLLPTISNVRVCFQRLGDAHLRLPIASGVTGQLIFNQRSIDGWIVSGGEIDPLEPRRFSLSDAVFYPGLYPNNKPMKSSAAQDSIELKLKDSYLEILANGKFKITNSTEELFDLMVQILGKMVSEMTEQGEKDFTNTIFGPQQPINFAKYVTLKADYEALKTKMESLKG